MNAGMWGAVGLFMQKLTNGEKNMTSIVEKYWKETNCSGSKNDQFCLGWDVWLFVMNHTLVHDSSYLFRNACLKGPAPNLCFNFPTGNDLLLTHGEELNPFRTNWGLSTSVPNGVNAPYELGFIGCKLFKQHQFDCRCQVYTTYDVQDSTLNMIPSYANTRRQDPATLTHTATLATQPATVLPTIPSTH